jgi:hypothetical protein
VNRAENPFEPRLEGASLRLTLDGRSLSTLSSEDARERDLIVMLAGTPVVDALVLDWPSVGGTTMLRGRLADPDRQRDMRVIEQAGVPGGFFGGVQPWSSREQRADQLGLVGSDREWFLYYEAVTWDHRNSDRHFFVTADQRLLRELTAPGTEAQWTNRRIVTIRKTLELIGLIMRSRDVIYLDADGNYTRSTPAYTSYFELSWALAPARVRLHRWVESQPDDELPVAELADLEQSIFARVMDLLRARDQIALQCLRTRQDNATLDEILYHLRAALLTTSALADSVAVFAQLALRIDAGDVDGLANVSLAERKFRQALRGRGGNNLADRASAAGPMWKAVKAIRNPIAHRSGVAGVTLQRLPGPTESRITLASDQAIALEAAARQHGEQPTLWGLDGVDAAGRRLDPLRFVNRFVPVMITLLDDLVDGLANDLNAPLLDSVSEQRVAEICKLAVLAGLAEQVRITNGTRSD